MRDRRTSERQSETVEATITEGLTSPIRRVRVVNLSRRGAEIETDGEGIDDSDLSIRVGREGVIRKARVAWRRMERFGLVFEMLPEEASEEAASEAARDAAGADKRREVAAAPLRAPVVVYRRSRNDSNVIFPDASTMRPVVTAWRPPSLSEYLLRDIVKSASTRFPRSAA